MFDGLFNKKPGQPANAPLKAPIPPQRSTPGASAAQPQADLGKDNGSGDFQSVVDEAAIVFAGGEERVAAEMLIDFLKQTNGQANKRVWFMLLDIYQALSQKDQYEKLSLMFANRFGTSPPSWEEAVGVDMDQAKSAASKSSGVSGGKNVMIIEGGGADQIASKTKEFVVASREAKSCKLDVSRMKMDASTLEGITALNTVMATLRKHKVAATLMGENHVAAWLEKKIAATKEMANPSDVPYWYLLLEILQWRGLMDAFEEMSLDFTITFELSGPGWEPTGVMTIEAVVEAVDETPAASDDEIIPDEIITDVSIQRLQEAISLAMADKGVAKLNFRNVRRMAFSSAGAFLNLLLPLNDKGKNVIIVYPSELIIALGDVVGFGPLVSIVQRKR